MFNAGYEDKEWQLVYATPPMPIPNSSNAKFPENKRLDQGCPFKDADLDWANDTLIPQIDGVMAKGFEQFIKQDKKGRYSVTLLNDTNAFDGHRLCEKTTDRTKTDTTGVSMTPDYAKTGEHAERANGLFIEKLATSDPSVQQEAVHPNFWGQRALASCVRLTVSQPQDYSDKEIFCEPVDNTLNQFGDPNMKISKLEPIPGG